MPYALCAVLDPDVQEDVLWHARVSGPGDAPPSYLRPPAICAHADRQQPRAPALHHPVAPPRLYIASKRRGLFCVLGLTTYARLIGSKPVARGSLEVKILRDLDGTLRERNDGCGLCSEPLWPLFSGIPAIHYIRHTFIRMERRFFQFHDYPF